MVCRYRTWACSSVDFPTDHIKRHAKESKKHNYTMFLVPRVSTLVSQMLEEEGVLGDVIISAYNLQFIPLADDVISLECDSAFKDIWVVSPSKLFAEGRPLNSK